MIYGCGDTYCTLAVEDDGDINGYGDNMAAYGWYEFYKNYWKSGSGHGKIKDTR